MMTVKMERVNVDIVTDVLTRMPVHVFDMSDCVSEQLYQPFAWGDVFLREVNRDKDKMILHIWPMQQTLILGMLDRRLPKCEQAIKEVRTHGYRAVVRNVGGLAVVADEGIMNFSFILPKRQGEKLSIQDAYLLMVQFVSKVFQSYGKALDYYMIEDSYCPGDFDMSIDGKKFAGIAQRRFKEGVSVSIYLSVCGNQKQRGELVRKFYEKGLAQDSTSFKFPMVNPDSMANLSDLLQVPLTVQDVKHKLLSTLCEIGTSYQELILNDTMNQEYQTFYEKMIERNRKA